MESISLPQVVSTSSGVNTAVFRISPLFPGYGHTIGNSLRRVLLSSLPGAAVTSVKIDGVNHEFSTVGGVSEDAVELILNLKNVRVQMHETLEPITMLLSAKGPGKVLAQDFKPNASITIANPELHIATLGAKSSLNLEVTIEYGRGYDPVEKRESKSLPLGTIAIDSLFTPVQAVSLEVENTRVGKMTNYDELRLSITTDGTISPDAALKEASAILVDQFALLAHFDERHTVGNAEVTDNQTDDVSTELVEAGIPPRVSRILADNGISTLASLKSATDTQLAAVSGLGPKALTEINKVRG